MMVIRDILQQADDFEEQHTEGFYGCYINEFFMFFNCFLPIVKRIAHEHFIA